MTASSYTPGAENILDDLSTVQKCGRCGRNFKNYNNLGQLQCRQLYVCEGMDFYVSADHMAVDVDDEYLAPLDHSVMRLEWPVWAYREDDDQHIDVRLISSVPRPKPETIVSDTGYVKTDYSFDKDDDTDD